MKLTLLDGNWDVEVFLDRSEAGFDDNVFVQISEECPDNQRILKSHQLVFGISANQARELARRLVEVAAEDEAWAKAEMRDRGGAPGAAPKRKTPAERATRFTPTQGKYLAFIHRYQTKFGRAPAESDIQRHMLVSAPSVNAMMFTLERRGLIVRTPGKARSIQLLVQPELLPPS